MGREPAFIVKVKVPDSTKGSWFVTYSKKGKMIVVKRKYIKSIYAILKRKVMDYVASSNGGKTGVSVFYPHRYRNESKPSPNPLETIWVASCFLEDYLSRKTTKRAERDYFNLRSKATPA